MYLLYYLTQSAAQGHFIGMFSILIHLITIPLIIIVVKLWKFVKDLIPFW